MIDRNGKHSCGWCGNAIRKHRIGRLPPECCSEECAKSYAKDLGRSDDWMTFLESHLVCSACGNMKENSKYRWCSRCRQAWRAARAP